MEDFARDLWIYIWDSGLNFRAHIKSFYSDLKDISIEPKSELIYWIAYSVALRSGRLPDHLHNRMIFANNQWVKKYLELVDNSIEKIKS